MNKNTHVCQMAQRSENAVMLNTSMTHLSTDLAWEDERIMGNGDEDVKFVI